MKKTGNLHISVKRCEKRRALFHSTLEPKHTRCSASLSQSQRSFTFVNSISTLLNKEGTHANVLVLLRTSVLQQNKHKHSRAQPLCSNLVRRHERSEGRRSRSEEQTQSNTHFFKGCPKASPVLLCSSCTLQATPNKLKASSNVCSSQSKQQVSNVVSRKSKTFCTQASAFAARGQKERRNEKAWNWWLNSVSCWAASGSTFANSSLYWSTGSTGGLDPVQTGHTKSVPAWATSASHRLACARELGKPIVLLHSVPVGRRDPDTGENRSLDEQE